MKVERKPMRSGFCSLTLPTHERCRLDGCPCECHATAEPITWEGDNA